VDLSYRISVASSFIFLACCPLFGAAKLRLDNTALGPISVATGANGPTQTVNASNAGDGALGLSATSSVTWLSPTVNAFGSCGLLGDCNPIKIALNTASLAKGTYTGLITVSDPNAVDAPQTISVTVNVGGGVPDSITLYIPNNGTPVSQSFSTGGRVTPTVNQPAGGPTLSLALPSGGSFAGTFTYTLTAQASSSVAAQTYNGSIVVAGSPVVSENKTVPVTLNVTSQPIASLSSANLSFRVAANAFKQTQYVFVTNPGAGTLTISGATPTTTSGGSSWLTATPGPGYVGITADPTGLQPGNYAGSVAIASNAANSTANVPVSFTVLAASPPVVRPGVVNNATFSGDTLAQGDFPALFGEQLTAGDALISSNAPYPTTLGGATVFINNQPAPLYYVSATQINFLIPFEAQTGDGTLRVDRDGQRGNTVSIKIAPSSPKLLLAANQAGQKVSVAEGGALLPVHAGDYLVLYGFGFGATVPAVPTNTATPASPLSNVPGTNNVFFGVGGLFQNPVSTPPQFIGLAPTYISAFYQINVQIPVNAPKGSAVPVFIQGAVGTTNSLLLNIQ
jgi:uncharacterized protein (TIGR03437 family)